MPLHGRHATDSGAFRRHDDADIGFGLEDLGALLCDAIGLRETLARIADYSVHAGTAVDGAAVRLADETERVVAGAPATQLADDLHDTLGEGPALDALATGRVTRCGSLGGSERWRRFGPRAGRLGLHSVLSLPLILPNGPVGTITVYAATKDAFTQTDVDAAQYYALPTAAVIRNAALLERSRQRVEQLTEALRVRPQIDRAIGVIMSRTGKSADEALETLRRMSNIQHVRVSDLAGDLVDEAVRRAQRRTNRRPNSVSSEQNALRESS
jgi:GAF domain-containing protein